MSASQSENDMNIRNVIDMNVRLYNSTGIHMFKQHAQAISMWMYLLKDDVRESLGISYKGTYNHSNIDELFKLDPLQSVNEED